MALQGLAQDRLADFRQFLQFRVGFLPGFEVVALQIGDQAGDLLALCLAKQRRRFEVRLEKGNALPGAGGQGPDGAVGARSILAVKIGPEGIQLRRRQVDYFQPVVVLTARHVPQQHGGAAGACRQRLAIRRKGQRRHIALLAVEPAALLAGGHLPEARGQPAADG